MFLNYSHLRITKKILIHASKLLGLYHYEKLIQLSLIIAFIYVHTFCYEKNKLRESKYMLLNYSRIPL
jgi:hypothetical protein